MKFTAYLKDKIIIILIYLAFSLIIALMLLAFKTQVSLIVAIMVILALLLIIIILYDFIRKKNFYNKLVNNIDLLDKKYLVLETLNRPSFYEGNILFDHLYEINKSMIEEINRYSLSISDFKEYIEMWIHEVKIPISSLILMCHNDKRFLDKKYIHQISKLDNYIDQVLYYVRSENTEKDFIIKEYKLDQVISQVALKNKDDILENKINFIVDIDDLYIRTDIKWLEFILNQIINNSIKYKKNKDSYIKISSKNYDDKVVIIITDNGIGIEESDLPRIFDKSFTGTNGREKVKSTGMGLYIVKNLCEKLGHIVDVKSEVGKYTSIYITIMKNDYYDVTKL